LVNAVDTPVSGFTGLGPAGLGPRAPTAPAEAPKNGPVFEQNGPAQSDAATAGTAPARGNLNPPASGAFAAQAIAQNGDGASAAAFAVTSPKQAAAAYQTTESQTDPRGVAEVILPGLPARLSSGRAIDVNA